MSKIKIKQIDSVTAPDGAILTANGDGTNSWELPQAADGSNVLLGDAEDGSYTSSRYTGGRAPAGGCIDGHAPPGGRRCGAAAGRHWRWATGCR